MKAARLVTAATALTTRTLLDIGVPRPYCAATTRTSEARDALCDKIDLIDDFTTGLVIRNTERWAAKMPKNDPELYWKKHPKSFKSHRKSDEIHDISRNQIDATLSEILRLNRPEELNDTIHSLFDRGLFPSKGITIDVLKYASERGDAKLVEDIQNFYRDNDLKTFVDNYGFEPFAAYCLWSKGRIEDSLRSFLAVLKADGNSAKAMDSLLRELISRTTIDGSEASVVVLTKYLSIFAEELDCWRPMSHFWICSFLSERFYDRSRARELFLKYPKLRLLLGDSYVSLTCLALHSGRSDTALDLLELLLLCGIRDGAKCVIAILFEHRLKTGDVRGCKEILLICPGLNMKLSSVQYERFLKLFIETDESTASRRPERTPTVKKFKLEF